MPIRDGQSAVKAVMEAGGRRAEIPAELYPLRVEVRRRAQEFLDCYFTCRDNTGARCLGYNGLSHEAEVWHIGLMFVEYVAGLLLDKAKIGHCYAQTKSNPTCSFSRDMHLKMVAALKADLFKLAKEIDDLEDAEKPTWPAADPHPTPP